MPQHFLKETDIGDADRPAVFAMAAEMKRTRGDDHPRPLAGQSWGMVFYKNSTRTRISFEVGIQELGGRVVRLDASNMQVSRGESLPDTARVLGRYLHGLVIRAFGQDIVEAYAAESGLPVVNALTDLLHPCQIYSDCFTLAEKFGEDGGDLASLRGRKLAFFGDTACNMANSWVLAGKLFGLEVVLCGPESHAPGEEIRNLLRAEGLDEAIAFTTDPAEAAAGADAVYTDVWVSMGDEAEADERLRVMRPYAVTAEVMAAAGPHALFMHCMPAHPGEEVAHDVLASPRSIMFDQAENRLHMQKGILAHLAETGRLLR